MKYEVILEEPLQLILQACPHPAPADGWPDLWILTLRDAAEGWGGEGEGTAHKVKWVTPAANGPLAPPVTSNLP